MSTFATPSLGHPEEQHGHEAFLVPAAGEHTHASVLAWNLLNAMPEDSLALHHLEGPQKLNDRDQRVVVAPTTARGLADATALIATWRPGIARPALLLVRDAPLPVPPIVTSRATALMERVEVALEIRYLHEVRLSDDPALIVRDGKSRRLRKTRKELAHIRARLYAATFLAAGPPPSNEPVEDLELSAPPTPVHEEPSPASVGL